MHVVMQLLPVAKEDKKGMLQDTQADCGSIRHCGRCATMLEALGRAWHARSAGLVASAQLHEAELRMRVTANATAWPMFDEVHVCNQKCNAQGNNLITPTAQRSGKFVYPMDS